MSSSPEYMAEYRRKNKDKIKAQRKLYRAQNPKIIKEYREGHRPQMKLWIESNLAYLKEHWAAYKIENSDTVNAANAKRRASLLQRTPPWLTDAHFEEITQFYVEAKELQWLSEEPLHVDHIIPLQGKNVSGLHVPWNLQILPRGLNLRKSNK